MFFEITKLYSSIMSDRPNNSGWYKNLLNPSGVNPKTLIFQLSVLRSSITTFKVSSSILLILNIYSFGNFGKSYQTSNLNFFCMESTNSIYSSNLPDSSNSSKIFVNMN